MFVVYLLPQGGVSKSFQIPWGFAGLVPGREEDINKYRPYCMYKATKDGSLEEANFSRRLSVALLSAKGGFSESAGLELPSLMENVLKYRWYSLMCAALICRYVLFRIFCSAVRQDNVALAVTSL